MRMSNKAKAFFEKAKLTEEYWVAKAKMDFSMELARNASDAEINGKTLADKIKTSPAYISKVFRGQSNLTIDSMVKLARATGANVEIKLTPIASENAHQTVTLGSCQVIPIPTKMMKTLTKQKSEINREHVLPPNLTYDQMLNYISSLQTHYLPEQLCYPAFEQQSIQKTA